MRTVIAENKHESKKIERVIRDFFPNLTSGMLFKALRKKDIKVNGVRVKEDYVVSSGDIIDIYIIDDFLFGKSDEGYSVVFEDNNLLVVNKAQGIPVHPDSNQKEATLIDKLQKQYGTDIALCHRLDRNTSGLVVLAKNQATLDIMLDKIKHREIQKYYNCVVSGIMEKKQAELTDYLEKNEKISKVFISDKKSKDSVKIVTRYNVIKSLDNLSLLEVELITGKTHQIRAHLSFYGHPIIGDGKYGKNTENKRYSAKYQMLCANKLTFAFTSPAKHLDYLKDKTISIAPPFDLENIINNQKF